MLEALASGTPVIVPRAAPFIEYLSSADALWVDPLDARSIALALRRALDPAERSRLVASGLARAAQFPWRYCAKAHVAVYRQLVPKASASTSLGEGWGEGLA